MWDSVKSWFKTAVSDIANKLWQIAKLAAPVWAFFEFLGDKVIAWLNGIIDDIKARIMDQAEILQVDLTPSQEFQGLIAKANVIVPLEESWSLFLIYLGFASVVVGIKWMRNLIPGLK